MAFDKLIISGIVGAAKSSNKMDLALDSLKDRLVDTVATKVEKEIPIELPFNVKSAILDGTVPTPTPQLIAQLRPIPESKKQSIRNVLDAIEDSLNISIKTKNSLQGALTTITSPLNTIQGLSGTIGGITTGLKAAVLVLKVLPIPTSVPPGVGIPVNVINGFSDSLDTLGKLIDKFDGPITVIPTAVKQINAILAPIVAKLNILDPIFELITRIIALIRILLEFGPDATQEQIDSTLASTASRIQQSTSTSGLTSNINLNSTSEDELLERLQDDSSNPLFYKDFRLTIQYDSDNKFSFPSRRVKGVNPNSIVLYNLLDNGYSFSSIPSVLVEEIQFRIDTYLLRQSTNSGIYSPFGEPGFLGERRRIEDDIYEFSQTDLSLTATGLNLEGVWEEVTDFTPFLIPGRFDRDIKNITTTSGTGVFSNSLTQKWEWDNSNMVWFRIYPPFRFPGNFEGEKASQTLSFTYSDGLQVVSGVYQWSENLEGWFRIGDITNTSPPPPTGSGLITGSSGGGTSSNTYPPFGVAGTYEGEEKYELGGFYNTFYKWSVLSQSWVFDRVQ
jgi:hypothetical protein